MDRMIADAKKKGILNHHDLMTCFIYHEFEGEKARSWKRGTGCRKFFLSEPMVTFAINDLMIIF